MADMSGITPTIAALAGGIFPALAWLWFWRREDSVHPEPRRLIALAFLAGMVAVALVIPIQKYVATLLSSTTVIYTAWSAIEEIMKYLAARFTVLRRREDDEPIDPVIYMVAVALGFAAIENTLFLLSPLSGDTTVQTIITGNLRFVGATLLHVLSSAAVGVMLGLSFYKPKATKRLYALLGVILATLLHSAFNFFILNTPETHLMRTFGYVWIGLIVLLAVLEYIKRIHPRIFKS
ncbi:MAG: PrsW family intramembrane metalloprotease [Candidatus Kaiserbacteria bacterium]|nr:PrsW family intramembrane metalloprotease [Candidatus Kaiserbacteria bacterium]